MANITGHRGKDMSTILQGEGEEEEEEEGEEEEGGAVGESGRRCLFGGGASFRQT